MKTNTRISKLQKSSGLFMQLGLVLILFTVYLAFEHKTEEKGLPIIELKTSPKVDDVFIFSDEVEVEKPKTETALNEPIKEKPSQELSDEVITSSDPTIKDTEFLTLDSEDKNPPISLGEIVDVGEGDELESDSHLISNVQEVPIYPGCEKVIESKRRACFEKKVSKHIARKFNKSLGSKLGLSSGKKRINVEFMITNTGEIEVTNTSAIHIKLEKEGERIINKLPNMIPGKHNGKEVNVKYTVPIIFNVE